MSGPTDYMERKILDTFLGTVTGASLGTQSTLALGLFLVMPADDGTGGTEVANSGNYARVAVNASVNQWGAADSSSAPTTIKGPAASNTWVFNTPSGNWGDTVGVGIFDSLTYGAGNMLWTAQWTGGIIITINNGDPALTFDNTHQITFQCGDPSDPFT